MRLVRAFNPPLHRLDAGNERVHLLLGLLATAAAAWAVSSAVTDCLERRCLITKALRYESSKRREVPKSADAVPRKNPPGIATWRAGSGPIGMHAAWEWARRESMCQRDPIVRAKRSAPECRCGQPCSFAQKKYASGHGTLRRAMSWRPHLPASDRSLFHCCHVAGERQGQDSTLSCRCLRRPGSPLADARNPRGGIRAHQSGRSTQRSAGLRTMHPRATSSPTAALSQEASNSRPTGRHVDLMSAGARA